MKKSPIKRLIKYIAPYKKSIILSLFLSVLSVALTLIGPLFIGKAIDNMSNSGVNFKTVNLIITGLLFIFVLSAAATRYLGVITNKICYRAVKDIRADAFKSLSGASASYTDSQNHGVVISKIVNDADIISEGLIQGAVQLFTGIITVLATLIIMFAINFYIALAVLILTPASLVTAAVITKNAYKHMSVQAALQGDFYSYVSQSVSGLKTIKAFGGESQTLKHYKRINANLNSAGWRAQYIAALTNPTTRFVNGIVFAAVCVLGAVFVVKSDGVGAFSVGTLSVFLSYANQYTKPFNEVSSVVTQMSGAITSAGRIFAITDIRAEDNPGGIIKEKSKGGFEIENVSFSYDKTAPLIENFNLKVNPGDKIAIVGPTGCGKTTLINLLMRFYKIDSGSIKLDGTDIGQIELKSYRKLFGMVLQDTFIFTDTVFNNIAYGKENTTQEEVEAAAKAAHADYFISNLKDGYETVLTDSVSISAGERQLICIARIILANPQILILDEATSNVDIITERYVQAGFSRIMQGKTSFIVAHRLSTVTDADNIIVMDKGNIVEQGKHEQLLGNKGFYYELFTGDFT